MLVLSDLYFWYPYTPLFAHFIPLFPPFFPALAHRFPTHSPIRRASHCSISYQPGVHSRRYCRPDLFSAITPSFFLVLFIPLAFWHRLHFRNRLFLARSTPTFCFTQCLLVLPLCAISIGLIPTRLLPFLLNIIRLSSPVTAWGIFSRVKYTRNSCDKVRDITSPTCTFFICVNLLLFMPITTLSQYPDRPSDLRWIAGLCAQYPN